MDADVAGELQALHDLVSSHTGTLNQWRQNGLDNLVNSRSFRSAGQRVSIDRAGITVLADSGSAPPDLNLLNYLRVVDRMTGTPQAQLAADGGTYFQGEVTSALWLHRIGVVNPGSTKTADVTQTINATSTTSALNAGITNSAYGQAYVDGTLTDGVFQVSPMLEHVARTTDPAAPNNGSIWYRSDLGTFRMRIAGVTVTLSDSTGAVLASLYTTKGDILIATAANTPARLGVGANNTMLVADSTQASGTKWASTATQSIPTLLTRAVNFFLASSTTETNVLSFSIPGNTLGSAGAHAVRFYASGYYLNNTVGTPNLTLRWYYGAGAAMGDTLVAIPSSAQYRSWVAHGELTNDSSTNSQKLGMRFELSLPGPAAINALGTFSAAPVFQGNIRGSYSADSTAAQTFKFSAQHGTNDANIQFGCDQVMLEVI